MADAPTPNPSLADRLDAAAADLDASKQMAVGFNDPRSNLLRAAAARLRDDEEQLRQYERSREVLLAEIARLTAQNEAFSRADIEATPRLRKLDRIEAAIGDVPDWIDALEANIGNHCTVMSVSAQADLVTLFRRLADALEVPDADT